MAWQSGRVSIRLIVGGRRRQSDAVCSLTELGGGIPNFEARFAHGAQNSQNRDPSAERGRKRLSIRTPRVAALSHREVSDEFAVDLLDVLDESSRRSTPENQ
jgi:hypothetical protein